MTDLDERLDHVRREIAKEPPGVRRDGLHVEYGGILMAKSAQDSSEALRLAWQEAVEAASQKEAD